jgi:hypothetical protein
MKHLSTKLSIILFVLGCVLNGSLAIAQSPLNWEDAQRFDSGADTSVSVTPSGLVVEFQKEDSKLWYHVGSSDSDNSVCGDRWIGAGMRWEKGVVIFLVLTTRPLRSNLSLCSQLTLPGRVTLPAHSAL